MTDMQYLLYWACLIPDDVLQAIEIVESGTEAICRNESH